MAGQFVSRAYLVLPRKNTSQNHNLKTAIRERGAELEFENLPLHDASVLSINYEWKTKLVSIIGEAYNSATQKISPFKILFLKANLLSILHTEEWGNSNSILKTAHLNASEYTIQMQSGDLIVIKAESFRFE